jgi:hypothetical protein
VGARPLTQTRGADAGALAPTSELGGRGDPTGDGLGEVQRPDRLAEMIVHAGLEASLPFAGHGIRGERHDRHPPLPDRLLPRSDRASGVKAVHVGQLAVPP